MFFNQELKYLPYLTYKLLLFMDDFSYSFILFINLSRFSCIAYVEAKSFRNESKVWDSTIKEFIPSSLSKEILAIFWQSRGTATSFWSRYFKKHQEYYWTHSSNWKSIMNTKNLIEKLSSFSSSFSKLSYWMILKSILALRILIFHCVTFSLKFGLEMMWVCWK